jgi:hypothetical protein
MSTLPASREQDVREGLDAIQEDMAEHQRSSGKLPTGEANRELAAAEFEKLAQRGAFLAEPVPTANPVEPRPARETKDVDGKKYVLTRDAESGPLVEQPLDEREETLRILQRLRFLLTLRDPGILGGPSWQQRVVNALDKAGATQGAAMLNPRRFAREIDEVLEDSNKYFGDWRKDPERKIIVGG